jgi:hypothetical protein
VALWIIRFYWVHVHRDRVHPYMEIMACGYTEALLEIMNFKGPARVFYRPS